MKKPREDERQSLTMLLAANGKTARQDPVWMFPENARGWRKFDSITQASEKMEVTPADIRQAAGDGSEDLKGNLWSLVNPDEQLAARRKVEDLLAAKELGITVSEYLEVVR